jgi:hypothetical protein
MAAENLYRPGTNRRSKIWNFLGLGVLLLLMAGLAFLTGLLARNTGLVPALLSGQLRLFAKSALPTIRATPDLCSIERQGRA